MNEGQWLEVSRSTGWSETKIVDDVEPIDLGPVRANESLVAVCTFDEEPEWMLYILTHKVDKALRFTHRQIGRCTGDQLAATLNTGQFYSEAGTQADWTPDTFVSVIGHGALYDYVTKRILPEKWRDEPNTIIRSRVRVWPIYQYEDDVPLGFRIARGNSLVVALAESFEREYLIAAIMGSRDALAERLQPNDDMAATAADQ